MSSPSPGKRRMDTDVVKLCYLLELVGQQLLVLKRVAKSGLVVLLPAGIELEEELP